MVDANQNKDLVLRYPASFQGLALIGFVCVFFYAYLFAGLLSFVLSQGAPFYLIGAFVVFILINVVFEFGQEIISETFHDRHEVPVFSIQSYQRGRFGRQLLMTALFGSLIFGLVQYEQSTAAFIVTLFVAITLPASLSVNALYENFKDVINPRTLIAYIIVAKADYVRSLLGISFLSLIFTLSFNSGFGIFSIALPFWLYLCLVFFRHLGLVARAHRSELLPERDYEADKKEIDQHFSDNASIHAALEKAYIELREKNQIEEAINIISPIIRMHNWGRFDFIFDFLSAWPSKVPAMHFVKEYLPSLKDQTRSIRALELCTWCLKQDSSFLLEDTSLVDYLIEECVSVEQFVVAVKLLDNFVREHPGHEKNRSYLVRASDICQDKLHHQ